ncbi:MAG: anti-sigma factor [Anaerolineae bacterium]|nr:anti-sigma factor [Anaerolineae bacterium]
MNRDELLDLIPAYALDALDAEERAAVEGLLRTDAEARQLLAEYQALGQAMTLATPARRAPAHLQADLRKRLAAESSPKVVSRGRSIPLWIPAAVAAAVVVIVGALALIRPGQGDPGADLYAQIVAQTGHVTRAIQPAEGASPQGEMVYTADGKQAVIRVSDLPALGAEQTFQLWLIDATGARSGGLLRFDDPSGPHYIVIPLEKPAQEYAAFGVSTEPVGGSPLPDGPSSPPIFAVVVG